MNIKTKIRDVLTQHYGEFNTGLETEYQSKLTETLLGNDLNQKKAWITYNQVILELKHSIKDMLKVKELQYRLTESKEPNIDCIEVLENVKNLTPELERLYYKIKNF